MKVFLFDYDSRHAQAIIYSLRRHAYDVVVGTPRIPNYHFGVSEFLHWDGTLASLKTLLARRAINIVMPISIRSCRFCAQHKASLTADGIKVLISDLRAWHKLYNKAAAYEAAGQCGIPVPRSTAITPDNYRDQIARAGLHFTLVVKSVEEGGARFVRYANSLDDCQRIFRRFLLLDPDVFRKGVIAQEYIPGSSCAYFCLADDGRIIAEFGHRRLHENPPSGGVSTCCATFRNDRMFALGRTLVRSERYSGPCMIEFKHDEQRDQFVLIEVNPKFWGSSLLPIICGLNFPVLYVRHLMGEPIGPSTYEDKTLQFVLPDLIRALKNPTCIPGFLKMLFHGGVWKDIPYFGLFAYMSYYARR